MAQLRRKQAQQPRAFRGAPTSIGDGELYRTLWDLQLEHHHYPDVSVGRKSRHNSQ